MSPKQQINPVYIANHKATQLNKLSTIYSNSQAKMNSSIKASSKTAFHTFANVEFSGVYDRMVYDFTINPGDNRIGSMGSYHLFIKYGDKVYMEVKGIGEIVVSFAELQNNRYWNYYYNLSLKLTHDKHMVFQHLRYSCDYHLRYQLNDNMVYPDEERFWGIDTAFIETSMNTRGAKIVDNEAICYYKINPYDLMYMDYSSQEDVDTFLRIYMTRAEIKNKVFDRMCVIYNRIISAYQERWMTKELEEMEKELDELSIIFEDKKNVFTLSNLHDKNGMNNDILMIIYNNLISAEGNNKYETIVSELGKYGRLESDAQILNV